MSRKPASELRYPYRRIGREHVHRRIVEQRTGIKLPSTAEVHHVNPDDKHANEGLLVVCQDKAYHRLIEQRTTALRECGNANWRKCIYCCRWDAIENMQPNVSTKTTNGRTYTATRYRHARHAYGTARRGGRPVIEHPEACPIENISEIHRP